MWRLNRGKGEGKKKKKERKKEEEKKKGTELILLITQFRFQNDVMLHYSCVLLTTMISMLANMKRIILCLELCVVA
jgi:hypothetical protein